MLSQTPSVASAPALLQEAVALNGAVMFISSGAPGMVLVVVRGPDTVIQGYGVTTEGKNITPDGKSLVRLGSVTKVFAGEVLAWVSGSELIVFDSVDGYRITEVRNAVDRAVEGEEGLIGSGRQCGCRRLIATLVRTAVVADTKMPRAADRVSSDIQIVVTARACNRYRTRDRYATDTAAGYYVVESSNATHDKEPRIEDGFAPIDGRLRGIGRCSPAFVLGKCQ